MTIHHLLRILIARKWWIAISVGLCLAAGATYLEVTPRRYVATASVVVNARGGDPLALGSGQGQGQTAMPVATQAEIVKRPRVARRVVTDLGLQNDSRYRDAWVRAGSPGEYEAWLADSLVAGVSTVNAGDSSVIDIQYRSADPKFAARMANAFAAAYLATTLELRTDSARQYVEFFDKRLVELRTNLEQAQARLSAFEKKTGLVNAGGKLDVENARLAELSSQLAAAQGQVADSTSRERGAQRDAATSPEIIQNGLIQSLKGQLATQQVKVAEMSLRLGPGHPAYIQAQGELAEIRNRLNAEIAQVSSSMKTEQRNSGNRMAEIQAALDAQRQRVLSMQEERDQAAVFQKEVENAQRAYDLVMQRQTQTTLESQAQQTDAAWLDHASTPGAAAFPNERLTWLLSLVAGILLGAVLALGREFFSPMVRSSEDLLTYTGLPVLAIVPSGRLKRFPPLPFGNRTGGHPLLAR